MIELVAMSEADAPHAAALHLRAFSPDEAWTAAAFAAQLRLDTVHGWAIAVPGDRALRALVLLQDIAGDGEILTLATDPAHRRQGLARRLLAQASDDIHRSGGTRLILDVAADNLPARTLYNRLGFTEDGRRRRYFSRPGGIAVDAILMSARVAGQAGC